MICIGIDTVNIQLYNVNTEDKCSYTLTIVKHCFYSQRCTSCIRDIATLTSSIYTNLSVTKHMFGNQVKSRYHAVILVFILIKSIFIKEKRLVYGILNYDIVKRAM